MKVERHFWLTKQDLNKIYINLISELSLIISVSITQLYELYSSWTLQLKHHIFSIYIFLVICTFCSLHTLYQPVVDSKAAVWNEVLLLRSHTQVHYNLWNCTIKEAQNKTRYSLMVNYSLLPLMYCFEMFISEHLWLICFRVTIYWSTTGDYFVWYGYSM